MTEPFVFTDEHLRFLLSTPEGRAALGEWAQAKTCSKEEAEAKERMRALCTKSRKG